MKDLIPMTDYLPDHPYSKFLKRPLTLGMFVPCNEEGRPMDEPENYQLWRKHGSFTQYGEELTKKCVHYKKAKEKVLFEGLLIVSQGNYGMTFAKPGSKPHETITYRYRTGFVGLKTIEDLTHLGLKYKEPIK